MTCTCFTECLELKDYLKLGVPIIISIGLAIYQWHLQKKRQDQATWVKSRKAIIDVIPDVGRLLRTLISQVKENGQVDYNETAKNIYEQVDPLISDIHQEIVWNAVYIRKKRAKIEIENLANKLDSFRNETFKKRKEGIEGSAIEKLQKTVKLLREQIRETR